MKSTSTLLATSLLIAGCATLTPTAAPGDAKQQVIATELAFAKTMADRDHAAFANFLSDEVIFATGPNPLRGKAAVAEGWRRYFDKPAAPFSWAPEQVEVLPSGNLALSTGPVHAPDGKLIGRFTSIWRLEAPNTWRIVFDQGNNP